VSELALSRLITEGGAGVPVEDADRTDPNNIDFKGSTPRKLENEKKANVARERELVKKERELQAQALMARRGSELKAPVVSPAAPARDVRSASVIQTKALTAAAPAAVVGQPAVAAATSPPAAEKKVCASCGWSGVSKFCIKCGKKM